MATYDILPLYGVKWEQIHITYDSTDTESLLKEKEAVLASAPLLPHLTKRALRIDRLVKWKRADLLIDTFPKVIVNHPDMELVIVGDEPELDNLKKQAAEWGLTGRIHFIGTVYSPKELGTYTNGPIVYALTGMGGLSINDVMTHGLPIACSVCDSTKRDLVTDGVNRLFFREGDADSPSDKLNELSVPPGRYAEMGHESERIICEKISTETISERYLQVFRTFMW